ncbi:MAG: DUF1266 domain-containing protein [Lachnospiraceae bacterium]|nr:DUF1266 domain-containing protein [Lachnospiraceae bacterium]
MWDSIHMENAPETEIVMRFKKFFILGTAVSIIAAGTLTGCSNSGDGGKGSENVESDKNDSPKTDSDEKKDTAGKEDNELSDTIRWFNASYAILTELNGWDYNVFGGLKPSAQVAELEQQLLEDSWSVTDRASADETLDWILTEGHRFGFVDNMSYLEECGLSEVADNQRRDFILENFDVTQEETDFYVSSYNMYEEYGAEAIDAWDYCRALNLMGFFYLAGYYEETEALDSSLEIAKTLQAKFSSWDGLIDSYLRGYEYWAEESSDARREVYEDLKKREDNPYRVDFNTELKKTW